MTQKYIYSNATVGSPPPRTNAKQNQAMMAVGKTHNATQSLHFSCKNRTQKKRAASKSLQLKHPLSPMITQRQSGSSFSGCCPLQRQWAGAVQLSSQNRRLLQVRYYCVYFMAPLSIRARFVVLLAISVCLSRCGVGKQECRITACQ